MLDDWLSSLGGSGVGNGKCGAELTPVVICESCRGPVTAADVDFQTS